MSAADGPAILPHLRRLLHLNMNITTFMKKWLADLAIVQKEVGVVPWICPSNNFINDRTSDFWAQNFDQCDALWGDAATLVPWAVYQSSGDVSILEQQYESMKAWVETEKQLADIVEEDSPRYIWKHGMQLGDWLAPGKDINDWTDCAKWTSTAYYAHYCTDCEQRLLPFSEKQKMPPPMTHFSTRSARLMGLPVHTLMMPLIRFLHTGCHDHVASSSTSIKS